MHACVRVRVSKKTLPTGAVRPRGRPQTPLRVTSNTRRLRLKEHPQRHPRGP